MFGMAKVPGTIDVRSGSVSIADGQTLVTAELATATIATGNKRRDKDLRSRRFLDVDAEPTLRFDGKLIDEHTLHGTLRRGEHHTEIDLAMTEVSGRTVRAAGVVERTALGVGPKSRFIGRTVRIELTVVLLAQ
jgi:polyisoprenoid-binding protein YceI